MKNIFTNFSYIFLSWILSSSKYVPLIFSVNSRWIDLVKIWHYSSRIKIEGDYLEFGVFKGDSFKFSIKTANNSYKSTNNKFLGRFFAFDSFMGLPKEDSLLQSRNIFKEGEYKCSLSKFLKSIRKVTNSNKIEVVDGWFNDTLTQETRNKYKIIKAAVVLIDCDLYESTVSCLDFIYPILQTGTILIFDDWYLMKGSMVDGEPKALFEWLREHKDVRLINFCNFGIWGRSFIVNKLH